MIYMHILVYISTSMHSIVRVCVCACVRVCVCACVRVFVCDYVYNYRYSVLIMLTDM